jgi:hypothetical protein
MANFVTGFRLAGDREFLFAGAVIASLPYYTDQAWNQQCMQALGGESHGQHKPPPNTTPRMVFLRGKDWQIIAIEGTTTIDQWLANIGSAYQVSDGDMPGMVHAGFLSIFAGISGIIRTEVENGGNRKVILIGHSLGGALSHMAAHMIRKRYPGRLSYVLTYGEPRSGDVVNSQRSKFKKIRVVTSSDVVPTVPPPSVTLGGVGFPWVGMAEFKWQHSGDQQTVYIPGEIRGSYSGVEIPPSLVPDGDDIFNWNLLAFGSHALTNYCHRLAYSVRARRSYPFGKLRQVANEINAKEGLAIRFVQ